MAASVSGIKTFNTLSPSNSIADLICYIQQYLPLFADSHTYNKIIVKKKNETQHTTALSVFMMKFQDRVTFMPEVYQKGSAKIDIGVYDKATDDLIFTIEAKILPTPKGTKTKPRAESEYVYAPANEAGAGIERFKNGVHGLDTYENPLLESGMVAYIKENSFEHWLLKVNQWITDAQWDSAEHLKQNSNNSIAKLTSIHLRVDKSAIKLHHFWILVKSDI